MGSAADHEASEAMVGIQAAPIVLVHGLIGSLNDSRILGGFNGPPVYAPDLMGYGEYQKADLDGLALADQAEHLSRYILGLGTKVHVVGHSVGGAVSALMCRLYPELVLSFTSVEGNFTLKDAFWSRQIAKKSEAAVAKILDSYKANPERWLSAAGVPVSSWTSRLARTWLHNQPASTIRAQAKAVIAATQGDEYLEGMRDLVASSIPVHLIAGARSSADWDVPDWVTTGCTIRLNIAGAGHLMMAESPSSFARAVLTCVAYS
jgi:pimeloyl-ACP methyl ester carboxylesterase